MEALAKSLKSRDVKNDSIYTSPSIRTVQSAMMIAKIFKKEYIVAEDLKSRNYGRWNGMTMGQILAKYPDGFGEVLLAPKEIMGEDAESSEDLISRVKISMDKIVSENIGNRIIIVTYPEIIQAAICAALDIPADKLPKIFIRTGSATQISYFENWASLVYSDSVPL